MKADHDPGQEAVRDLEKEVEAEAAVDHDLHVLDPGLVQDLSVDQEGHQVDQEGHQVDQDQEIVAQSQRVDQEVNQYPGLPRNAMLHEVSVDQEADPNPNQEVVHVRSHLVQEIKTR